MEFLNFEVLSELKTYVKSPFDMLLNAHKKVPISLKLAQVIGSSYWKIFFYLVILLNTLATSFHRINQGPKEIQVLVILENIFLLFYLVEQILIFLSFGGTIYWKNFKSDGLVVFIAIIGVLATGITDLYSVFRVFPLLRLVTYWDCRTEDENGIPSVGQFYSAIRAGIPVAVLMFLVLYFYAILGVIIWSDSVMELQDIPTALAQLYLFQISADYSILSEWYNNAGLAIYFISFWFIGVVVLLNLFTALIVKPAVALRVTKM